VSVGSRQVTYLGKRYRISANLRAKPISFGTTDREWKAMLLAKPAGRLK
jgi:hypothetical protein